jgi:hypothetical protein
MESAEDNRTLSKGDYRVLSVADNGLDMCADIAAKIFEPFLTTRRAGKDIRPGLSQVRPSARNAQNAGGMVSVDSAPGLSTTVNIFLRAIGRIDPGLPPLTRTCNRCAPDPAPPGGNSPLSGRDTVLVEVLQAFTLLRGGMRGGVLLFSVWFGLLLRLRLLISHDRLLKGG